MLQYYSEERCQSCPDRVVCRCLQVTEAQIVETITNLTIRNVKELVRATGAGDGCTCCHQQLKDLIERCHGGHCGQSHPDAMSSTLPVLSPIS